LNLHEVKDQLSKYIEMVEGGATIIVCKRNVPVAEIRPIEQVKKRTPKLGWAEGQVKIRASFIEPISEDDLKLWEGGDPGDPLRTLSLHGCLRSGITTGRLERVSS
jgi:antitoxin (DNA-binding transcriptional repressor) of toxin-antitoxin stability system